MQPDRLGEQIENGSHGRMASHAKVNALPTRECRDWVPVPVISSG
jgi:hypothetical protein